MVGFWLPLFPVDVKDLNRLSCPFRSANLLVSNTLHATWLTPLVPGIDCLSCVVDFVISSLLSIFILEEFEIP